MRHGLSSFRRYHPLKRPNDLPSRIDLLPVLDRSSYRSSAAEVQFVGHGHEVAQPPQLQGPSLKRV
jgi:hypothetical protein